ncbi:hypothetical protein AB3X89_36890 [Paraburkholderia sp. BR14320]|uniref:hypothetical protein n=1 Tax=Paraburkholderia sp. BR14264 TaxID=3237001 RepID=UPI0034D11530
MNDTLVSPLLVKQTNKKSADYSTTGHTHAGTANRLCDQPFKGPMRGKFSGLRKQIVSCPRAAWALFGGIRVPGRQDDGSTPRDRSS